jgi:VCBS repeat-containing protein
MALAIATVVAVTGQAWILNSDGSSTELRSGSPVPVGANIKTAPGSSVTLRAEGGMPLTIGDDNAMPVSPHPSQGDVPGSASAKSARDAAATPIWEEAHRVTQRYLQPGEPEDDTEPDGREEADDDRLSYVRLERIVEKTDRVLILNDQSVARATDELPRMKGLAMAHSDSAPSSDDIAPVAVSPGALPWQAPNSSPSARDDRARTGEKSSARGNVLANDTDPDGDALHVAHAGGQAVPAQGLAVAGSAGGRFFIHRDGSYAFDTGKDFHGLAEGETRTTKLLYTIDDGRHASSTAELEITVTGTNDLPIVTPAQPGQDAGVVEEDGIGIAQGKLDIDDADHHQSAFREQHDASRTHGTFGIDSDGHWQYGLDNDHTEVQALALGETLTDEIPVLTADGTESLVHITINGANDAPVVTGEHKGDVTEDGALTITGRLAVSDVDATDTHAWSIAGPSVGAYGSIQVDPTGLWAYTVDPLATQSLADGEQKIETFTVLADDGHGGRAEQVLTLTVTGTNDTPVIGGEHAGALVEDTAPSVSGRLSVEDADIADSHAWSVQGDPQGGYGALAIDQAGEWTYTADDRIQALAAGANRTDTFVVQADDGHGGKAEHAVSVSVTGANDAPVIGGKDTGAIVEDKAQSVAGQLSVEDVDIGDSHTWSVKGDPKGSHGDLAIGQDGKWIYTPDERIQSLAADVHKTETFTVLVNDGQGGQAERTIRIGVTGQNDKPVVGGKDAATIVEDTEQPASGQLTVEDVDIGDTHTWSVKGGPNGDFGTLALDQSGKWTYTPDSRVRSLPDGEKAQEIFTLVADDGHGGKTEHVVTVTVIGTNDAPTIVGAVEELTEDRDVTDDGFLVAAHQMSIVDSDAGENGFRAAKFDKSTGNGNKPLGELEFRPDGTYSYKLDNGNPVLQGLPGGQSIVETYVVTSMDGSATGTITVIINGTNDPAVVTDSNAALTEDSNVDDANLLIASGKLTVADRDDGESRFLAGAKLDYIAGNDTSVGELAVDADGTYRYAVDNSHPAVQGLQKGESIVQAYKVTSKDGTAAGTITVTIDGTDDKPVVTVDTPDGDKGTVREDAVLEASGKLKVVDADHDQSFFRVQDGTAGKYGTFAIDTDGKWRYKLDNDSQAVQSLGVGDTLGEKIQVLTADGTETFVEILINGANDAPAIGGEHAGEITEDASRSVSGQLSVQDADAGDTHTWSAQGAARDAADTSKGEYGTLTVGQDGKWTYSVGDSMQSLAANVRKTEKVTVLVDDGNGGKAEQVVTLTLIGVNDVPVVSGKDAGTIAEDGASSVSGQLSVHDVDAGDSHAWSLKADSQDGGPEKGGDTLEGSYGTAAIDQAGKWVYTPDDRIQSLADGEKKSEIFTVLVDDGQGGRAEKTLTLALAGKNDVPEIGGPTVGSVTEDTEDTVTGKLQVTDKDIADRHTWSIDGPAKGKYGSLSVNGNGEWTYTVDRQATQQLVKDQGETETFTVMVDDGHGGVVRKAVTINVMGANDVPTITPHDPGAPPDPHSPGSPGGANMPAAGDRGTVIEDARVQASGKLDIADKDRGENAFRPKTETDGYGTFDIGSDGNWTYTLDNSDPNVQALSGKDSPPQHTFEAVSADGTAAHAVKINVIGANDAPVSAPGSAAMPIGGKHTFTTGEFAFQDSAGEHDRLQSVIVTRVPDSGTLTLGGKPVAANQPISAADIAAGKLVYTPASNSRDASFRFKVRDDGGAAHGGRDTSDEYDFKLATGKLVVGTNESEDGSARNRAGLDGASGDDIVVGDPGGVVSVVVPGNSYNIVMMLDVSSSMQELSGGAGSQKRIDLLKDAVKTLMESLGDHVGGTVNLLVMSFSDDAKRVVEIPDMKKEHVQQVLAQLKSITPESGTNYVEPFKEATRWLEKQPARDMDNRDYKNVAYFITDGEPRDLKNTLMVGEAEAMQASIDAFKPLSRISAVYAVGMGQSTKKDLQFFDNTPEGDSPNGGKIGSSTVTKSSKELIASDIGLDLGGSATVYTTPQVLKANQGFAFDLASQRQQPPTVRGWELQVKGPMGDWRKLEGQGARNEDLYSGSTAERNPPSVYRDGEYRMAFFRLPEAPYNGANDGTFLKAIAVTREAEVSGAVCEPQNVNTARELKSALSVGAFREEADAVGRDHIDGRSGNDILFGDSINTDHLHSRNHPAGKHDGYGMQGLRDFLADGHGHEPTQTELHAYIRQHHAELNKDGDMRGENDVMRGREGNDILYGQGGNDELSGDAGDDILIGGTGNDILEGGSGSDTFVWMHGDGGKAKDPAIDAIPDFDIRSRQDGGDVLDLRDLLSDPARDDLSKFLHFDRQGQDTVVEISTAGSARNSAAPAIDQKIVLQGVDLTGGQTLSDAAILNALIQQGKLLTALSDAHS